MKSFTKQATAIAILTAIATPSMATEGPTLFGKAHLSFGSTSEDKVATAETSSTAVTSHASRVGIKGSIDTDSSVKVVYRFVWEIDMDDNAKSSSDQIKSREQFVGLKDSWGELRIGRDDSPYKKAGKKNVEHLSDTWADYNNIINKDLDLRNDDSIGFWSKVGPGKLGIQYGAGADNAGSGQENEKDVLSFAYDTKMGAIGFAVAYQDVGEATLGAKDGAEGTKIVIGYKAGDTQFGIISESVDQDTGSAKADEDNILVSVKHKVGKGAIKLSYGTKDVEGVADDATMTALAYDYKLSKKVSVYGLWADGSDDGLKAASKLEGDGSALVAGIIAKF
jgi:predicted porin